MGKVCRTTSPGRSLLPSGKTIHETVQLLDVAPTILALSGISTEGLLIQGDSLLSLVEGNEPNYWQNRIVLSEEPTQFKGRPKPTTSGSAFYKGRHYLRSLKLNDPVAFDFHDDPDEMNPLGEENLGRLSADLDPFLDEMLRINNELRIHMSGESDSVIEYDPDSQDQLRALGYIQ